MRLRNGTALLILGLVFFRAFGSICGGALVRGGQQPISISCVGSVLRHVQASTQGFGPSPVVMSELLCSLSDSPTLAFLLVLSTTAL